MDVDATYDGDGYFCIAKGSTALHVAAWKAWPNVVMFLLARGASVNVVDGQGCSALALAVKACVDSYWTNRRTPASVEALLRAGASTSGVLFPSGYDKVDDLLRPSQEARSSGAFNRRSGDEEMGNGFTGVQEIRRSGIGKRFHRRSGD